MKTNLRAISHHQIGAATMLSIPQASQHCTALSVKPSLASLRNRNTKATLDRAQDSLMADVLRSCDQRAGINTSTCHTSSIYNCPPATRPQSHRLNSRQRHRTSNRQGAACWLSQSCSFIPKTVGLANLIVIIMFLTSSTIVTHSFAADALSAPPQLPDKPEALVASGTNDKQQPQAEAISASNQNVILIKYANVSKETKQNGARPGAQQLNVFQLYNEPLSVSVIESKFSHSIQLFDVSQNQLSTLPNNLFCPLSNEVRQLNISHNLLENFDCLGLISQAGQLCLSELRILDMSFNLIKHLPATGVATLQNLEVLNLSNNLIESLDELSLTSLFRLAKLDLSWNRIQQLPMRIFHKSTSMRVLRLQSNYLHMNINQMFLSGLISLEEINLSSNNISHVSELAFMEKPNLTRVDLSHNQLNGLRQEALRVTYHQQVEAPNSRSPLNAPLTPSSYKPRLHHNGQYVAGPSSQVAYTPQQQASSKLANNNVHSQQVATEFYLSSNPFICDCQLEWMRKFQQQQQTSTAIRRSVLASNSLTSSNKFSSNSAASNQQHLHELNDPFSSLSSQAQLMQNDQPAAVIQPPSSSSSSSSSDTSMQTNLNNISENVQQQATNTNHQQAYSNNNQASSTNAAGQHQQQFYGRIADLEHIKCTPLFRRNTQLQQQLRQSNRTLSATSSGDHHNYNGGAQTQHHSMQVHHPNNHLSAQHHGSSSLAAASQNHHNSHHQMIDLLGADSSNFLCRYKSHCFALCHCCEFDACDCEMICPHGCNCYYDSSWQTNIIDCSSNNHKVVPDRIPMDVSGLYLDGNNIDSLRPSNLIARKSLKTLYLNSSNLQFIANRTFNGLVELQTLYLHENHLRTLNGYEFLPLAQLKALYLQSNRLEQINNQTFIYLRSLEILDLSNNRLTSLNLDLFVSIGHHNIRLRQLSIAHNWWSCQCSSIQTFRQILKQKFLVNGGVQISDRNQLRCYYNSTTVGPLILDGITSLSALQQPVFGSFAAPNSMQLSPNNRQQQLTEINQCSELPDDRLLSSEVADFNPPVIQAPATPMVSNDFSASPPASPNFNDNFYQQQQDQQSSRGQQQGLNDQQQPAQSVNNAYQQQQQPYYQQQPPVLAVDMMGNPILNGNAMMPRSPHMVGGGGYIEPGSNMAANVSNSSAPLTYFLIVTILFVCMIVIALSMFVFVRQQRRFRRHHKKSSAASTTSASSSASSTAISAAHHHHHSKLTAAQQQQYHTLHHHLIMGDSRNQHSSATVGGTMSHQGAHHHHHQSASSQSSNIYAALVSPTTGSSTIVTSSAQQNGTAPEAMFGAHQTHQQQQNNLHLYSNSSTTASSNSSQQQQQQQHQLNGHQNYPTSLWPAQHQQQQPFYGQHSQYYGQLNRIENPYAIGTANMHASGSSYAKTAGLANSQSIGPNGSLYNLAAGGALPPLPPANNCRESLTTNQIDRSNGAGAGGGANWIKLPKVKQFMARLVNKSLALGGYRLRDELGAAAAASLSSDKIYDAFLSYDKRDEPFVMQHLAAELEYGQPQFR